MRACRIAAVVGVIAAGALWGRSSAFAETAAPDTFERVDLVLYLLGDKPADADDVYREISKLALKDINATLRVEFIPWADFARKYSTVLASGEQVDLIYASNWARYAEEAARGAFREVTPELLMKCMPLTWETQDRASFDQARIGGKVFFVPKNETSFTGYYVVAIRGDLRERHGLPRLKSLADYGKYLVAVSEGEKGISPVGATGDNDELRTLMFEQGNNLYQVGTGDYYVTADPDLRSADRISLIFGTPEYLAYVRKMRSWAEEGIWPKTAISRKTPMAEAFEGGACASLVMNLASCGRAYANIALRHPEWKPEIYDLTPDAPHQPGLYTDDGYAVAASSRNPERAFMMLDLLKNDPRYYLLAMLGIRGRHWDFSDDGAWRPGPEYGRYPAGAACAWGLNNRRFRPSWAEDVGARVQKAYIEKWTGVVVHPTVEGFQFDDAKVKAEAAAMDAVASKYVNVIELGFVDPKDGLARLMKGLRNAGLAKYEKEYKSQLDEFLLRKRRAAPSSEFDGICRSGPGMKAAE
jgi:putative aldouronate transport system substrate-binding protein